MPIVSTNRKCYIHTDSLNEATGKLERSGAKTWAVVSVKGDLVSVLFQTKCEEEAKLLKQALLTTASSVKTARG